MNYTPPYTTTSKILKLSTQISEEKVTAILLYSLRETKVYISYNFNNTLLPPLNNVPKWESSL